MRIGVLAVQGAFAEHLATLGAIGVKGVEVRLPSDLEGISGLILPGGESTAQRRLIDRWALRQPILDLAKNEVSQYELLVRLLVGKVDDDTSQARDAAVVAPVGLVDNPLSKAVGRQLQG